MKPKLEENIFLGKYPKYLNVLHVIYIYTLMENPLKTEHLIDIFVKGLPQFKMNRESIKDKEYFESYLDDIKNKKIISNDLYKDVKNTTRRLYDVEENLKEYFKTFSTKQEIRKVIYNLKKLNLIINKPDKKGYDFYILTPKGKYGFERYYIIEIIKNHVPDWNLEILLHFTYVLTE